MERLAFFTKPSLPKPSRKDSQSSHTAKSTFSSPLQQTLPADRIELRFAGKNATRKAQQQLLTGPQLNELLAKDADPYLGALPKGFKEFPKDRVLNYLNHLAARYAVYPPPPTTYTDPVLQAAIHTQAIDAGNYGRVFKLTINGHSYAFKVFRPYVQDSAPFEEAAIGMYFTAQKTRDLSKLYISNPSQGWTLMEYIDPETGALDARKGKTLDQQGYWLTDDSRVNRINGIRVDHGGPAYRIASTPNRRTSIKNTLRNFLQWRTPQTAN